MSKKVSNVLTYLVIIVIGLFVFYLSSDLQVESSKILPLVINSLMIGLALLGIALELFKPAKDSKDEKDASKGPLLLTSSEFFWFLPLTILAVGCMYFGFYLTSFVFVAAYIRLNGGSWKEAAIFSISTPVTLYVVFDVLLKLELATGSLWDLIC